MKHRYYGAAAVQAINVLSLLCVMEALAHCAMHFLRHIVHSSAAG